MSQNPPHVSKDALAPDWYSARERIFSGPVQSDAYVVLAILVDHAGAEIQKLQSLFDYEPPAHNFTDSWTQLLDFVLEDLTDVMRGVSLEAAALVPGERWLEVADPPETLGNVALLVRYLSVAVQAGQVDEVPECARAIFREIGAKMGSWSKDMTACVTEIASEFLDPARRATGADWGAG